MVLTHIEQQALDIISTTVKNIEDLKEQKVYGKRPAQYVVHCHGCGAPVKMAFTAVSVEVNGFRCFNCMAEVRSKTNF